MDQEVKRTFTTQPMISYRSARKLSSYLVMAKLCLTERKVGSCKCKGKSCVKTILLSENNISE